MDDIYCDEIDDDMTIPSIEQSIKISEEKLREKNERLQIERELLEMRNQSLMIEQIVYVPSYMINTKIYMAAVYTYDYQLLTSRSKFEQDWTLQTLQLQFATVLKRLNTISMPFAPASAVSYHFL
ncbi:unnamed protein product [Brugia pahangi]|uniref:Uncharacterized protein n=1 Tax=Brugia pahangi TaxID=6280 RepID=A0A0N4TI02_BRUPA|nr:unnamed protein product [Brugia pahangi]